MLTTAPYLRVRRPSPTTAEFIVSTLPPLTLPLRLALYTVNVLRLVLGLGVLLLLYSVWIQSPYYTSTTTSSTSLPPQPQVQLQPPTSSSTDLSFPAASSPPLRPISAALRSGASALLSTPPGRLCARAAHAAPWWVVVPAALGALYGATVRLHTEERLLVLRGLGIQTSSSRGTALLGGLLNGATTTRFIPTEKIQDVLINEAFRGFEVRHCLLVVVVDEEEAVVVFPGLLPRPGIIEKVWRGARACLYEHGGEGGGGGGARVVDGRA
ncbi:GPI-GlcNAc transferase complex, PIG-H component-domain-containing protein [Xylariaceae sp. FL0662B]|nr:GPI-GlcNAc transferase complex, PIG-H component-domain-containing protein [Xylariaceae sp. FL0662B]